MFDVSTQYDIDTKLPIIEGDIPIANQNERKLGGYKSVTNTNEAVVLVEILKEQRDEGHSSEAQPVAKLTESFIDEGGNRLSGVSRFNDMDCGEPATAQHLRINFGMTEDDNTEEEKKCRSFWKFIESHPQLEKIKVYPIPIQKDFKSESSERNDSSEPVETAMEWIQKDDLIKAATESKFTTTYCHADGGDYCDTGTKTKYKDAPKMRIGRYKGIREGKPDITARTSSEDELKNLCKRMDEWDVAHTLSKDRPRPRNVKDVPL